MREYTNFANSMTMFIICSIPLIVVVIQAVGYLRIALKRSKELGMDQGVMKKVITNSAVFSILPSIPIIITMAALMPALGKYLPWLRLSVIGSAAYESMCADMTIVNLGFTGLGDTSVTSSAYISVIFVMSCVAISWPLCTIVGSRIYDKAIKKAAGSGGKGGGFMVIAAGALFIGLMAVMGVPRAFNFADMLSIIVIAVSGVSIILLDFLSAKSGIKILSEFSFPLAMIFGMLAAIIFG